MNIKSSATINIGDIFWQIPTLIRRAVDLFFSDKKKVVITFLFPIVIGLIITLVTDKDNMGKVYEDTRATIFTIVSAAIYVGMFNSLTLICKERAVLKREHMTDMSFIAYITSNTIVQAIICFIQSMLFMIVYWSLPGIGFVKESIFMNSFVEHLIGLFLIMFASDMLGMLVSSIAKSSEIANLIAPIIIIFQLVMGGVLFSLEGPMEYIANFTVSKWGMQALGSASHITNLDNRISTGESGQQIVEMFRELGDKPEADMSAYEFTTDHITWVWMVMLLMGLVLGIICIIALQAVDKDKR